MSLARVGRNLLGKFEPFDSQTRLVRTILAVYLVFVLPEVGRFSKVLSVYERIDVYPVTVESPQFSRFDS